MKITKNLKFADFSYDEEEKVFTIFDKEGNGITLNKVYSFAFMRFVIRIAQRNWLRPPPKKKEAKDRALADTAEFVFEDVCAQEVADWYV